MKLKGASLDSSLSFFQRWHYYEKEATIQEAFDGLIFDSKYSNKKCLMTTLDNLKIKLLIKE